MPDIEITIGGRSFLVACQPGEEHFLQGAARMLDAEAQPLVSQLGRMTESRMLLMAGLMMADRAASLDDELRKLRASQAAGGEGAAPAAEQPEAQAALARIADRIEAVALTVGSGTTD